MPGKSSIPMAYAQSAASRVLEAANTAQNEEQLKIQLETILSEACKKFHITWNPYSYEHSFNSGKRRLDAVHGSTIIEYEPPKSFCGGDNAQMEHAKRQAAEYAELLSQEEGRDIADYVLVAWDGQTIVFGHVDGNKKSVWDRAQAFGKVAFTRLVGVIESGGLPLVSPSILLQYVGPDTEVGRHLLPELFRPISKAIRSEKTTRTKLIFVEWSRLFGQVDGVETDRLVSYLGEVGRNHCVDYSEQPQAYVFALSTYIAIIAKICSVYSLFSDNEIASNSGLSARGFLSTLEGGEYFNRHGIANMLTTDFFSWYLGDDIQSSALDDGLELLLGNLRMINYDVTKKNPKSVRDLFKGLYMSFTPAPLRHALGEYYTPDWLASRVIDVTGWNCNNSILDPTCGSGTFLLEALRRRIYNDVDNASAKELLEGIYGFDLNPLAVITARASIVVFLSGRFDPNERIILPIYLADAINTADPENGIFAHRILTEKGERVFSIPEGLARDGSFFETMDQLRILIDSGFDEKRIFSVLSQNSNAVDTLSVKMKSVFKKTIRDLAKLHKDHWNGIWCLILFDRIQAGCIDAVDCVIGNPPWVKWSNLPSQYADFIKPLCDRMQIFSDDNWVGGIQSDISTVVTYHALERFVSNNGRLSFLITGTVFKNESSQGFRRWELQASAYGNAMPLEVVLVEDYADMKPFDDVSNWPTLLVIKKSGKQTTYPVPYLYVSWSGDDKKDIFVNEKKALPVPGSDAGPWLVGDEQEIDIWNKVFDASEVGFYKARKGITTDANGIYFLTVSPSNDPSKVKISNDPALGRRKDIAKKQAIVETRYIYPLLRGRDIKKFRVERPLEQGVLLPQEGMFGDESLPADCPKTFKFISSYKKILENRSSYKRFQRGKPFWSVWSTGPYTFSPYKVLWKEMSGRKFVAAYVGSEKIAGIEKVCIPDHKLYFIPASSELEAAYLTGLLNAPSISKAVGSYSSMLSLGTNVADYLKIPKYDDLNKTHAGIADLSREITCTGQITDEQNAELDRLAMSIFQNESK